MNPWIKNHPNNERIKRQYLAYLKEAKRHNEATVDAAAKALNRFEIYTQYRDFKAFHTERRSPLRGTYPHPTLASIKLYRTIKDENPVFTRALEVYSDFFGCPETSKWRWRQS